MDGGQRNQCGEDRQKLQKNIETNRKVIQQNTKNRTGMEEVRKRKRDGGYRVSGHQVNY
jgi:hypothetical protein